MQLNITPDDLYDYIMSAKDIHEDDFGPVEKQAMRNNYTEFLGIAEKMPEICAAAKDAAVSRLIQIGFSVAKSAEEVPYAPVSKHN